ncbi:hypothetical protein MAM1_0315d09573 [Mucor ambiguus]|uniref:DNA helicase Pif1-like 2B domain-containing protein n=1 Tax=Mucor ambiguus TaxID=91626 RepID=A0A0C9MRE5_9FUNG|nr:hypothetical protein MAM1_0315d09573 [Mucor ambiguus]
MLDLVRKCRVEVDMKLVDFIKNRIVNFQSVPSNCVRLYTTNKAARAANRDAVNQLPGELVELKSIDYPANNQTAIAALDFETHLISKLYVQIGAIVMLIRNMDVENGWSNGTLATVTAVSPNCLQLQHLGTGSSKRIYRV